MPDLIDRATVLATLFDCLIHEDVSKYYALLNQRIKELPAAVSDLDAAVAEAEAWCKPR